MKKLSIMIPSLYKRQHFLSELLCNLLKQCGELKEFKNVIVGECSVTVFGYENVEVIVAIDEQKITTGEKRNLLLSLAKNDYVASIDCDDYVYPYYVDEILNAIQSEADCVAMNGIYTIDGQNEIEWRLAKDYQNATIKEGRKPVFLRTTNHLSPVKRQLALKAGFPALSNAEDKEFSLRLNPHLVTEVRIDKPMYWYRYSTENKTYV